MLFRSTGVGGTTTVVGLSQALNPNAVMTDTDASSSEDFIMFPLAYTTVEDGLFTRRLGRFGSLNGGRIFLVTGAGIFWFLSRLEDGIFCGCWARYESIVSVRVSCGTPELCTLSHIAEDFYTTLSRR